MSFNELKELCNQLIGTWYCEELNECLTFHLNEELFQTESKLTVINSTSSFKPFDVLYGVGFYLGENTIDYKFYIDIGFITKRYFKVEDITKDKLVLREYWMKLDVPPSEHTQTYKRITDLSAADEILKGLDLAE
jgi:hypothetical protein